MEKRESVVMYRASMEALTALTSLKDVKSIVDAIIEFGMNGNTEVQVPSHLAAVWVIIKHHLKADGDRYQDRCDSNRRKAKRRWAKDATACHGMQQHATVSSGMPLHTDNDTEYDNDISSQSKLCSEIPPVLPPRGDANRPVFLQAAEKILAEYPRKGGVNAARLAIVAELHRQVRDFGKSPAEAEALLLKAAKDFSAVTWKWPESRKRFIYTAETFYGKGYYLAPSSEWEAMGAEPDDPKKRKAQYGYEFKA